MCINSATLTSVDAIQVSFCTTCMGFRHHLEVTLPQNLQNSRHLHGIEFVVVDYSSPDGLGQWIKNEFQDQINDGRLVYQRVNGRTHFCLAHAKNIAHRLARGRIVCNLDADNFTGLGFSDYLIDFFNGRHGSFTRSPLCNGTCGRVAMMKYAFERLGGYDERMTYGWGYEDIDLFDRAKLMGLSEEFIPTTSKYLEALQHPYSERVRFYPLKDKQKSKEIHEAISKQSIKDGNPIANQGFDWGAAS